MDFITWLFKSKGSDEVLVVVVQLSRSKTKYMIMPASSLLEDISMDFITWFLNLKGYDVVLVVVDQLSIYDHFIQSFP